jgi:peptidoglycan/xylan/chitin deacetylase (PgdA/CDA1 family)
MKILRFALLIILFALISSSFVSASVSRHAGKALSQPTKTESSETKKNKGEFKDYVAPDEIKALGKAHHKPLVRKHKVRKSKSKPKPKEEPTRKIIALTFDDGPHQAYTPEILRILKDRNVRATFFVVGLMAERYPYLVRAEFRYGHTVANHTYHHQKLPEMSYTDISNDITTCGDAIERIIGIKPRYFRPSGGNYNSDVVAVANSLGYKMVLWTDNSGDFLNPGIKAIVDRVVYRATPGGIILLHDGVDETLAALPSIIDILRSKGYEFVTMDELIRR